MATMQQPGAGDRRAGAQFNRSRERREAPGCGVVLPFGPLHEEVGAGPSECRWWRGGGVAVV
jgi:hypothetical protein